MFGIEQCRCQSRRSRPFDQLYVCIHHPTDGLFCFSADAPEFKSFPAAYTLARLGDALTLSCQIDSNPPANILWTRNGEFVGGGAQYQIPDVREEDYAVYACIATLGGQFTKIFASTKIVPPGRGSVLSLLICSTLPRSTSFLSSATGARLDEIRSHASVSTGTRH